MVIADKHWELRKEGKKRKTGSKSAYHHLKTGEAVVFSALLEIGGGGEGRIKGESQLTNRNMI